MIDARALMYRAVFFLAIPVLLFGSAAQAHFNVGTKVRQIVVAETETTTEIYIRTPIPFVFGDILNGSVPDTDGFLVTFGADDAPVVFLSPEGVDAARAAFSKRLSDSLVWSIGGQQVAARVRAYRILAELPETPMTTTAAGAASLARPSAATPVNIGLGYIDMLVSVAAVPGPWPLRVRSGLPPIALAEGVALDNHIVDVRGERQSSYRRPGQLERSIALSRTMAGRTGEYIFQGILHIIEGIDHVFLVVAMSLGAAGTAALIRSVTAFTLGHAVTLVAGFLGFAPQAPWFIPAVEASIAATIAVAAISSLFHWRSSALTYAGIGLLHGFGFSFVLGQVLGPNSPDLLPALASLTVGIEIGQISIVAAVLALSYVLRRISERFADITKTAVLVALGLIAIWMMIDRVPAIFAA